MSPEHGGKREGAGRKPLAATVGERINRTYVFTREHLYKVERFRVERGLKSLSEALRRIIEEANP